MSNVSNMTPDWSKDLVWRDGGVVSPEYAKDLDAFYKSPIRVTSNQGTVAWVRRTRRKYVVHFSWIVDDNDRQGEPTEVCNTLDEAKDYTVGYLTVWWIGLTPEDRERAMRNMTAG